MGAGSIFASLLSGAAKGFAKEKTRQKLKADEEKLAAKKRVIAFATDVLNRPNIDSRLKQLAGAVVSTGDNKAIKDFGVVMAQGGLTVTEDAGSALPAAAPGGDLPAIQTDQSGNIVQGQPQTFGLDEGPQIPGAPTEEAIQRRVQTEEFLPLQEPTEAAEDREIALAVRKQQALAQGALDIADIAGTRDLGTRIATNERVAQSIARQGGFELGSKGYSALIEAAINSAELGDNTQLNLASGFALNKSVPLNEINTFLNTLDTTMSGPEALALVKDTLGMEMAFAGENVDQVVLSQFANIRQVSQNSTLKKMYELALAKVNLASAEIRHSVLKTKQQLDGMTRGELGKEIRALNSSRDSTITKIAAIEKSMRPGKNSLTGKPEPQPAFFLEAQENNIGFLELTLADTNAASERLNDKLRELDGILPAQELPDQSENGFQPLPAHAPTTEVSLFDRFEESQRLTNMENVPMSNPEKFQLIANQMADMNDGEIFNFLGQMQFADNPNEKITPTQRTELEAAIKKAQQEGGSFFGRQFRPGVAQTR